MTPEEINQLSDSQLREKLKAHNGSCGPITDSTRSLYQKRLLKFEQTETSSVEQKSPENLTDSELYEELKKHNISCGPVTETTRSLYEKRLKKHIKEAKVPAEYISPVKRSPAKPLAQKKASTSLSSQLASYKQASPIEHRADSSTKLKTILTETETETEEVEIINYQNPVIQTNRYIQVPANKYEYLDEPTQKIYPELKPARMEFKLLDKQGFQKTNTEYVSTHRNITTSTSSYDIPTKKLNISPIHNEPTRMTRDLSDYRNQGYQNYATSSEPASSYARRPLINLEPKTLFKRRDDESDINYRGGTCYNEQPPPQPIRQTLPREPQNSQFNMTQFLLILVIGLCMLLFIYTYNLPEQNEVVLR